MTKRPMTPLEISQYNLRRALDFERRRLTDAEWRKLKAWLREEWVEEIDMTQRPIPPGGKIVAPADVALSDVIKGLKELRNICTPKEQKIIDQAIKNAQERAEQQQGGGEG